MPPKRARTDEETDAETALNEMNNMQQLKPGDSVTYEIRPKTNK